MGAGHVPVAWPALDFKIGDEGDMTMIATRWKDRQTMPQEQEICCFWGGDAIIYLEALSLASFVAAGHPVTLYAYHPSGPTPKGVIVKDAADILPQDAAPASLLADLFRYHCLAQRPGVIWVAPDFVLMQPLRTEDGRLLAEQGGGYLSPDVLQRVCENKRYVRLRRIVSRDELLDEPFADKALKGMLETLAAHWEAEAAETGDEDKAEVA